MENTEPNRKKGFGKTEDAVIELDQLHIVRNLGFVRPVTQSHFAINLKLGSSFEHRFMFESTTSTTIV